MGTFLQFVGGVHVGSPPGLTANVLLLKATSSDGGHANQLGKMRTRLFHETQIQNESERRVLA
jgi:hypothetical protein